jgi:hypothetical protein
MLDRLFRLSFDLFCLSSMAMCLVVMFTVSEGNDGWNKPMFLRLVMALPIVACVFFLVLALIKVLADERNEDCTPRT